MSFMCTPLASPRSSCEGLNASDKLPGISVPLKGFFMPMRTRFALLFLTFLIGSLAGGCGDEGAKVSGSRPGAADTQQQGAGPATEKPLLRTFVIVVDGMMPEDIGPGLTPEICRLSRCPGSAEPDLGSHATVYAEARAIMLAQTNGNHVAMVTGAYGDASGITGNSFYNRRTQRRDRQERPELVLVPMLFDVFGAQNERAGRLGGSLALPVSVATPGSIAAVSHLTPFHATLSRTLSFIAAETHGAPFSSSESLRSPLITTAAVIRKVKMRRLFDCTRKNGECGASDANPEAIMVTRTRPDFLEGGAASPAPGSEDCPARPPTPLGVAQDACIIERVIRLLSENDPSFMFISLGQVDQAQHHFGPASPEAYAAVAEADRQIGRFVTHLEQTGKWKTSVLFLLSDHGFSYQGTDPAQRIDLRALFRADREANPAAWGTEGGLQEAFAVIPNGGVAQVTLTSLPSDAKSLLPAQADALARMRQVALFAAPEERRAGISEALYRLPNPADPGHTLAEVHPDWHLDTPRAGDLIVTALASGAGPAGRNAYEAESGPGTVFAGAGSARGGFIGDHGHPGARHIPFIIASGGDFVIDQVIEASDPVAVNEGDDTAALPEQAETVDVAPTILWLHGVIPRGAADARAVLPASRGRVLKEAFVGGVPPGVRE